MTLLSFKLPLLAIEIIVCLIKPNKGKTNSQAIVGGEKIKNNKMNWAEVKGESQCFLIETTMA